jgi:hypothetical protein
LKTSLTLLLYPQLEQGGSEKQRALREEHVWQPGLKISLTLLLYPQLEQGGGEEQGALREEHGWHPGREGSLTHHLLQLDQGPDISLKPAARFPGSYGFLRES